MNLAAQLRAVDEAMFREHLVAERALRLALHFDEDVTPLRQKRDELRSLCSGERTSS